MKLGVCLKSLGLPVRRGLEEAARMGVPGVQIDAKGDLAPERLSETGKRELRNLLRGYTVELTALNCPLRRGLDEAEDLDARLGHVKRVMTLAYELGPRLVIVDAGKLPQPDAVRREAEPTPLAVEPSPLLLPQTGSAPRDELLTQSLRDLAYHGDRCGTALLIEAGLDDAAATNAFFDPFDTEMLGVNYDPANLLLNGHDPVANVIPLGRRVRHVHAHDAKAGRASRSAAEVPIGAGDVDWMALAASLDAIEYRGYLVVEQDSGDDRRADLARGVEFLRRFVR